MAFSKSSRVDDAGRTSCPDFDNPIDDSALEAVPAGFGPTVDNSMLPTRAGGMPEATSMPAGAQAFAWRRQR
jgi:hypothetical protein